MSEKINLIKVFDDVKFLLKYLGCWNSPDENTFYRIYKYFVIISCFLFSITSDIYGLKYAFIDTDKAYEALPLAVGATEAVVKSYLFRKNFQKFTESWNQLQQPEFQPRNEEQKTLLKNYNATIKLLFKVYVVGVYFCCVNAILISSWMRHKDLPTDHWFPFDYHKPFLYQCIYLHTAITVYLCSYVNCALDSCFFFSLMQIIAQCDVLANTLRNIHDLDKLKAAHRISEGKGKDEVMNEILIECMKHYLLIRRYTNLITDCFGGIITFQLIPSVGMICFCMYNIFILDQSSSLFFQFVLVGAGSIVQIFFYCLFGNLVTVTSEKLFYATFESQWYASSRNLKKNLITLMMTFQEPITFWAWNIFAINYETFKSIMRMSWSICVALKSTQDI
ncbi:odorant receptor Or1-like [Tribolium madens]|uniref:odorant receptor Or1-like n=1 Tax=Tribolium madens TaxID=41895 RepID=UPI001CF752F9|nr:odorant receptor Or1-like [Tribolium madens]